MYRHQLAVVYNSPNMVFQLTEYFKEQPLLDSGCEVLFEDFKNDHFEPLKAFLEIVDLGTEYTIDSNDNEIDSRILFKRFENSTFIVYLQHYCTELEYWENEGAHVIENVSDFIEMLTDFIDEVTENPEMPNASILAY